MTQKTKEDNEDARRERRGGNENGKKSGSRGSTIQ